MQPFGQACLARLCAKAKARAASCATNMFSGQCLKYEAPACVIDDCTTQYLSFPAGFTKSTVVRFGQRQGSSDGGAILLKAADRRCGLIDGLAGCLRDERQADKVDHFLRELLAQRALSIVCGYPDANDSARLASDPIHKMLLEPQFGRGSRSGFAADVVAL